MFAPIWEDLYGMIDDGKLISVDYVKIELERRADDWRSGFLTKANGMFHISEGIENEYAKVITEIEKSNNCPKNNHRERFLRGADPWLIACARSIGNCTVISEEKKSLSKYGMGEVCKELEVPHLDLLQFFVAGNIGQN